MSKGNVYRFFGLNKRLTKKATVDRLSAKRLEEKRREK